MADELLMARGRTGLDKSRGATGNPPVGTRQFFPSWQFRFRCAGSATAAVDCTIRGGLNGEEGGGGFLKV